MISQEKWNILTPLQNLPKNVGAFGKLIVAKSFKKLPKVQKIAMAIYWTLGNFLKPPTFLGNFYEGAAWPVANLITILRS